MISIKTFYLVFDFQKSIYVYRNEILISDITTAVLRSEMDKLRF